MAQQSKTGRPGAMTQAMQAATVSAGPKVLRIGIMQGTKMTEERVIRDRATVTVGTTEKNTFTIATQELPGSFELFPMLGGQYALNFTDRMEGRVALAEGVKSLADLRTSGAKRNAAGFQVALTEQSRGKVQLGDVTFLFQFVVPPPPQTRPQLPAAIRAGWVKNIDWTYNACLSFFLVLAMSGIAYVEYIYDPIVDQELALDDAHLVRLLAQPAVAEEQQEPEQQQQPDQNQQQQAAAAPQQQQQQRNNAPTPAQAQAARTERAANQANAAAAAAERAAQAALSEFSSAQFQALTGALDTGAGSARDNLAQGGLMNQSAADLAQTSGVSRGGSGGSRGTGLAANSGGSLGGRGLGAQGTVASSGNNVGSGAEIVRERVIRGNTSLGSGDATGGEGEIDASRVASLIRGQLGGIRSCYERALRNNPTLSGRIDVRFTIAESGRATSVTPSGMSEAPEVGTCIAGAIRRIAFPQPTGGAVEFSFPFTFNPGG
jgi:hypothetical protein